jgi:phosphomannomutase
MMHDQSIFRAYDMRGLYPSQMNESIAYAAGQGFVQVLGAKKVVVGRDVRPSGAALEEAMIRGITDAGANVIRVGVISTDMLYFAAATLECDGGMSLTASHNPAGWNGIKYIAKGARPITKEGELGQIYDFINSGQKLSQFEKGSVEDYDLATHFVEAMRKHIPADLPAIKMVLNPNFGALGTILERTFADTPIELVMLNGNQDGSFPKGTPDPLLPANRAETSALMQSSGAQIGFSFDADADRCFCFDEQGRFFHGYHLTALMAEHFLGQEPTATIVAERRLVWAVREAVAAHPEAKLVYSKTGHGYFKGSMREHNAIFGGEMSGHFYYRDFFGCDSGILTCLTVLAKAATELAAGRTIGQLHDSYLAKYPIWPQELNCVVPEPAKVLEEARVRYADAEQTEQDGLTVEYPTWYASLRMSSNEPVLRMNVEAKTETEVAERRTELLSLVESLGGTLRNDE